MANQKFQIVIKALDKTKGAFASATRGIKAVGGAVFNLKTALVGVAGLAGFGLLIRASLKSTDALAKTASKIGTTTEALGALRYAADITGVPITTMDMALQRFTRRTAEAAKGTGEAKGAIKELGIDARKLNNMPLEERMLALADAFAKQTNESDKLRLAFKLFDSEGAALVNTLSLGRDGLAGLMGEARALGVVMSSDAAQGVEDASNAFTRLGALSKGVRDQFTAALAPAITLVVTKLTEFFKAIADDDGGVAKWAQGLAASFLQMTVTIAVSLNAMVNAVGNTIAKIQNKVNNFTFAAMVASLNPLGDSADEVAAKIFRMKFILAKMKAPDLDWGDLEREEQNFMFFNRAGKTVESLGRRLIELQQIQEGMTGVTAADLGLENVIDVEAFKAQIAEMVASIGTIGDASSDAIDKVVNLADDKTPNFFDGLADSFEKAQNAIPSLQDSMDKVAQTMSVGITRGFTDAITGAKKFKDSMKDVAKSVVDSLIQMMVQKLIVDQLFGAITTWTSGLGRGSGSPTGSWGAPVGDMGGSVRGTAAIGGSVQAGSPYLVGERGQEIFVPNQSGSIVPNNKLGGGGVVVNQTINVTTGVQSTVRAEIANLMPQISEAAKGAVVEARMRGGSYSKALVGV